MDGPKDDFKWFGEGFDGFPKRLPEDCVEYTIYTIDSTLSDSETHQQLRQIQTAGTKLINKLLKDFIWQREGIHFDLRQEEGRRLIHGRTNYGDSVEDEWLIVYILRELSKEFPQIWIRVVDTDGQFLLIEAANAIPRWLNPEIADFRAWIHSGKLYVIPINHLDERLGGSKPQPKNLSLGEAIDYLRETQRPLLNSPQVEAEAFYRLQKYPQQILDSLHHTPITIPRKLAYILHHNAAYISPAVEAFYLRDPIALRPLQAPDSEGLHFPPCDCVTVSVKFTKVGYAQVKSQVFRTPRSWADFRSSKLDLQSQKKVDTGMKVTCGFEMLVSDPQNQDKKTVREIKLLLEDLETGEDQLPSDAEISTWQMREDSECWLDINFEDFEKELGGTASQNSNGVNEGFGDKGAQDQLRKMVARFQDFLDDDTLESPGAEYLDDMDDDDDKDSTSSDNTQREENVDASFNEDQFARMMKGMMGRSTPRVTTEDSSHTTAGITQDVEPSVSADEEDYEAVEQDMHDIAKELREAGALDLGSKPPAVMAKLQNEHVVRPSIAPAAGAGDADDKDMNISFNLAKNLLGSFESQGGMPGPGSNLMSLKGIHLPRDEIHGD
ncbi:hypothetical protein N7G274_007715 [Stereocaulon virgatum]|uniref:SGT1-domain-containing protein n=1 Tax=Stereocaulon virgatum TaxID=373712 RepID=A0ABR4A7Y0_9LECA